MKIKIKPVSVFVAGKGLMLASQVDVRVSSYELGSGAKCGYVLQWADESGKTDRTQDLANGNMDLKAEQFAAWAGDDMHVARCIVDNMGLQPAG